MKINSTPFNHVPIHDLKKKMLQKLIALLLSVTAHLGAPATAQLMTPTSLAPPPPSSAPQHTAIYTKTLTEHEVTATVVVTLVMPRSHPGYPIDGTPVTGTAISRLSAQQADGKLSTWSETAELYWTLTGNTNNRFTNTNRPISISGAMTTLYTSYTMDTVSSTEYYDAQGTHWHSERITLSRVTFYEAVDAAYPATIVRHGATLFGISITKGVVGGSMYSDGTAEMFRRGTTMVQVATRPTPTGLA